MVSHANAFNETHPEIPSERRERRKGKRDTRLHPMWRNQKKLKYATGTVISKTRTHPWKYACARVRHIVWLCWFHKLAQEWSIFCIYELSLRSFTILLNFCIMFTICAWTIGHLVHTTWLWCSIEIIFRFMALFQPSDLISYCIA